ncbi:MAG: amino acid adenylation domain-containing protein, partial [Acidobacteriota bacterium]
PDGVIDFLGRIDHQVKVRGFRIELGEVEAALLRHSAVRDAVVIARSPRDGHAELVAYAVADPDERPSVNELRDLLERHLPGHMVPAVFVFLEELPLTPNGKVDRRALPEPAGDRPELDEDFVAPRTETEERIAAIWREVLGVERIGVDDSFFALGGDSMRSLQVLARAREGGLPLSLEDLARHPTVAALARALDRAAEVEDALPRVTSEPFELIAESDREALPGDVVDAYPLTRMQAGMLFESERSTSGSVYHDVFSYRIELPLEEGTLGDVLDRLAGEHAVLRTSFDAARYREPLQLVHRECRIPLAVEDLRGTPEEDRLRRTADWTEAEKHRPFEWSRAPLLRVQVFRHEDELFQLTISFHHAILDGWSMSSLVGEIARRYRDRLAGEPPPERPALRSSFRDFVALERRALDSEETRELWRAELAGADVARLPRRAGLTPRDASRRRPFLDLSDLLSGLRSTAEAAGVPLKHVLLAAHLRVMALWTGCRDLVTGLAVNSRPESADAERILGVLLNVLPLRVRVGSGSWLELARDAFEAERRITPHRRFPLAEMLKTVDADELFETVFNYTHFREPAQGGDELPVSGWSFFEETGFTLVVNFSLAADADSLHVGLELDPEVLSPATARRIEESLRHALEALSRRSLEQPDVRRMLDPATVHALLREWALAPVPYPRTASVPDLFEDRVAAAPDRVAVVYGDAVLTYRALDERANRLARHLADLGVGPETPVALYLERGPELIVALLAILKAGGAYVPLDVDYPEERLRLMIEDIGAPLVVSTRKLEGALPALPGVGTVSLDGDAERIADRAPVAPRRFAGAGSTAYVIYTSGSTGRPKGVTVPHRGVVRLVRGAGYVPFGPEQTIAQASNSSFDAATFEIWGALLHGGCMVGLTREELLSPERLGDELGRRRITALFITTALFNQIVRERPRAFATLDTLLFGGEAVDPAAVRRVLAEGPPARLVHCYGPTESTTFTTCHPVDVVAAEATTVSIGGPIANTSIHVVDPAGDPVPDGVAGELWIGGDGLARCYAGRRAVTAERFVPDPWSGTEGGRLYRTGDLVRFLPDGGVEFVGRVDHQVKLRGFRIELGEIESELTRQPGITGALAMVRADAPSGRLLTAYLVADDPETAPGPDALRTALLRALPEYMVPAAFVMLDEFPLTANGKIDRRSLPAPPRDERSTSAEYVAPGTAVEETLAGIWAGVLGAERVGVRDNFFDLGGDSILSIQIVARSREAGLGFGPRELFEHQTVAELARVVEHLDEGAAGDAHAPVEGPVPLTPIQRWFFERDLDEPHHFNQALLLEPRERVDLGLVERAWGELVDRHEALRLRFEHAAGGWRQVAEKPGLRTPALRLDLSTLPRDRAARALERASAALQASMDLETAPLVRLGLVERDSEGRQRLLLAAHHLVVDAVSWRVLLEELERVYRALAAGEDPGLPAPSTPYSRWATRLDEWSRSGEPAAERSLWASQAAAEPDRLPVDREPDSIAVATARELTVELDAERTRSLLTEVPRAYRTRIDEVLLTALVQTICSWSGERATTVCLEGHGRESELFDGVDLSRSVGWFTTLFPVRLEIPGEEDPGAALRAVKEQLRRLPNRGIGYGALRYGGGSPEPGDLPDPSRAALSFNYLGQFDQTFSEDALFRLAPEPVGPVQSPRGARAHLLEVVGAVRGDRLALTWTYSASAHERRTVERVAARFVETLEE